MYKRQRFEAHINKKLISLYYVLDIVKLQDDIVC